MSKYDVLVRTQHRDKFGHTLRAEDRKETMLVLKKGETLSFSTLNLKAKYSLSGFITGKPLHTPAIMTDPRDIIISEGKAFCVGAVDPCGPNLSEVELSPAPESQSNSTRAYESGVVEWEA